MPKLTSKEISRLAGRIFQGCLPANWAVRSQEDQEDYGVDYEIELTDRHDRATGFIFKVQQKGVVQARHLADGDTVSFSGLPREKLSYYLRQLRVPLIFALVELDTSTCYWLDIHGNRDAEDALAKAHNDNAATVTLRIPKSQILPNTQDELLDSVERTMNALTVAQLRQMSLQSFDSAISVQDEELDALDRQLKLQQSVVRSRKTDQLHRRGEYRAAEQLNKDIFQDEREPIEARFSSGLEILRALKGGGYDQTKTEMLLKTQRYVGDQLVRLTCSLPASHHLRHYALFCARGARLRKAIYDDWGVFLSRQGYHKGEDALAELVLSANQRLTARRVMWEMSKAQHRMDRLTSYGFWGLVIYAWAELTEALAPFLLRLDKDGLEIGSTEIRSWLDAVGAACRQAAQELNDKHTAIMCAINHIRLGDMAGEVASREDEARAIVRILPATDRIEALEVVERVVGRLRRRKAQCDDDVELSEQELIATLRQAIQAQGIDLDNVNDPVAAILNIGIQDVNPSRVLRNCQHLLVKIDAYGRPGQFFRLPTAGTKSVICTKHHFRVSGLSLDEIYADFREENCEGCADSKARGDDWHWDHEWQKHAENEYSEPNSKTQHAGSG